MSTRTALVTGANRGLGLQVARVLAERGLRVLLTSRDPAHAARAVEGLRRELPKAEVEALALDVTRQGDIARVARELDRHTKLDVLVNNAGVALDGFDARVARETLAVNFFGALDVTDTFLPRMAEGGRIVFVSSGLGDRSALARPLRAEVPDDVARPALVALMRRFVDDVERGRHAEAGWPSSAYAVSKIGMTALAGVYARELAAAGDPRGLLANAACPGWVRTRMGGSSAPRSVEEGADTLVFLALLPPGGPTGGFFRDRAPASW